MTAPGGFLGRVVDWLREGYPTGIPQKDTIPVLAFMRRRLTDDELADVVGELRAQGLIAPDEESIEMEIKRITETAADPSDVLRVADLFAFRGFPEHVEIGPPTGN